MRMGWCGLCVRTIWDMAIWGKALLNGIRDLNDGRWMTTSNKRRMALQYGR